jgi:hypothetical protein
VITLPPNPLTPGPGDPLSLGDVVPRVIEGLLSRVESLTGVSRHDVRQPGEEEHGLVHLLEHVVEDVLHWLRGEAAMAAEDVEREVVRLLWWETDRLAHSAIGRMAADFFEDTAHALRAARDLLWKLWMHDHLQHPEIRFLFTSLDVAGTILGGIVDDDLLANGFFSVNGEELRAWLRRHGAIDFTVDNSPLIRGIYDLTFAYEGGDTSKPNLAAGAALAALIRIGLTYKGSVTYKMNAGMGDTVFTPLYQVLTKRGVDIQFFHWVTDIGVADDDDVVDTVTVVQQVDVTDGYEYLVDVKGLPCWPSAPDWAHIVDGDKLRQAGTNLEQQANPLQRTPVVLHRGVDFDEVVLAIAPGGLTPVTANLAARNPRFAAMLNNVPTAGTRAVQLWTSKAPGDMGWKPTASSAASTFVEPLDTYCDMSHLIAREGAPDGAVKGIGYFCGPTRDSDTVATVRRDTVGFLDDNVRTLWPESAAPGGGFEWTLLYDPSGGAGEQRLDSQYVRANTEGTERYTLSPAGTLRFRLHSDESGFRNLKLAGDWTRNGIDGGAVEAAVASGRLAAQAISGLPKVVYGQDGPLVDGSRRAGPPQYVEFGGLDTFPGPYLCKDTTLYSFMVEADPVKLAALVDSVLTRTTLGGMSFKPLSSMVMLSIGDIANVIPQTAPYNTYGSVDEKQLAVWVPVVRTKGKGDRTQVTDFWMFTAYIWVDNSMSMSTGREMYGWPKSMGVIKLPTTADPSLSLQSYSLNFGRNEQPHMMNLLQMKPTANAVVSPAPSGHTVADLVKAIVAQVKAQHDIDLLGGLGRDFVLADDAIEMALPEVYLKQFRSIEVGTDAALQQVCDSHARIVTMTFSQLPNTYQLKVQDIDSHPIAADLGIADQELKVGFKIEMDFIQDVGRVLWDTHRHIPNY